MHGPRGCGKASLCAALAAAAFPQAEAVCWLNMAHYAGGGAAAQLLGPPPGMVGHREGGVLTQQLRRRRRCLVVLENVPAAHPAVLHLFTQVRFPSQYSSFCNDFRISWYGVFTCPFPRE